MVRPRERLTEAMREKLHSYCSIIERYLLGDINHTVFSMEYFSEGQTDEIIYDISIRKVVIHLWTTAEAYQPDLSIREYLDEKITEKDLLFEARESFIFLKDVLQEGKK